MAKQTMSFRVAQQQTDKALDQVESILLGLYGTKSPEPQADELMHLLSDAKDMLFNAANELEVRLKDEAREAKTPAQLRHDEGCWASPDGTIPQKKKAKAGK